MRGFGLLVTECFCFIKGFAALALHHITKQGPRRARKPNQGHAAMEFFFNQLDRIKYIMQPVVHIGYGNALQVGRGLNRRRQNGTLAFNQLHLEPHGLRYH